MSRTTSTSTARTSRVLPAVALLAALALGGCTVQTPGAGDGDSTTEAAAPSSETPSGGDDGGGDELSSEEISARLLDEGEALAAIEPLGTTAATLEVSPQPTEVTLEVLEVRAGPTGTLVTMQVTAAETVGVGLSTFITGEIGNTEYPTDMDLVDPTTQERLQPITAAEGGQWCQCSFLPRVIGPEPARISAGFPALDPSTTTVDLRLGTFPVLADLPVTR
ncbi:hypothetical protein [Aquipuribacter hungaricus]|uniref:Lipoprotein n=1 Tax=Aquipuribacter hungaricus TaxID=545624 RepID=A0ABV7WK89_9MICO